MTRRSHPSVWMLTSCFFKRNSTLCKFTLTIRIPTCIAVVHFENTFTRNHVESTHSWWEKSFYQVGVPWMYKARPKVSVHYGERNWVTNLLWDDLDLAWTTKWTYFGIRWSKMLPAKLIHWPCDIVTHLEVRFLGKFPTPPPTTPRSQHKYLKNWCWENNLLPITYLTEWWALCIIGSLWWHNLV